MEFTGEFHIAAPPRAVWDALNDPDVLKECIAGCEEMVQLSPTEYHAKLRVKAGPVRARFEADIQIVDIVECQSYGLEVNAKGGIAGFGSGRAHVNLTEQENSTQLTYEIAGSVGGKIAQLGSRLISGLANKTAKAFFSAFCERWALPAS